MSRLTSHLTDGQGRLTSLEDGSEREQGYLTYAVLSPGLIDAQHTIVHPEWQGGGIAAQLAKALFALAQERGWRVRPTCSYIARYLERHPELSDLREG